MSMADDIRYEMMLTPAEARSGVKRFLTRNGKRLEVTIPPNVGDGYTVKLSSALQATDERPGDILIAVRIKAEEKAKVIEVTDATFALEVADSRLPVLVDFWAAWCGPCKMIAPVVEKLAGQYAGHLKFCKLNVDENPVTAGQFQVMSIPTLLFFKNGQVVDKIVGANPQALKAKIEALIS
jgi:thioredoxin 1